MKIALYNNHHNLPFWHTPTNPESIYNLKLFNAGGWTCGSYDPSCGWIKGTVPALNHGMFNVLEGLSTLELSGVMAHISFVVDRIKKIVYEPERAWVQITTEPLETDGEGFPIIVKNGVVQVKHLWGGDNKTYSPDGLLQRKERGYLFTPLFWNNLFLSRLVETKVELITDFENIKKQFEAKLSVYISIPLPK